MEPGRKCPATITPCTPTSPYTPVSNSPMYQGPALRHIDQEHYSLLAGGMRLRTSVILVVSQITKLLTYTKVENVGDEGMEDTFGPN